MSDTETENLHAARDKAARASLESIAHRLFTVMVTQINLWHNSVPSAVLNSKTFSTPKSRKNFLADRLIEKLTAWRDNDE